MSLPKTQLLDLTFTRKGDVFLLQNLHSQVDAMEQSNFVALFFVHFAASLLTFRDLLQHHLLGNFTQGLGDVDNL